MRRIFFALALLVLALPARAQEPSRDRNRDEWPPVTDRWRPKDYTSEQARGVIEYSRRWRNYAWHRVEIVAPPEGQRLTIRGGNFSQRVANTQIFVKPDGTPWVSTPWLSLIGCNLRNVKVPADAEVLRSQNHQQTIPEVIP